MTRRLFARCIFGVLLLTAVASAAQTGPYRIAGTVVNAVTGEPVRGATVFVFLAEDHDSHNFASTESGDEGRFVIEHLPAAKFSLISSKRGYVAAAYDEHENYNSAIVTGADQDSNVDIGNLVFRLTPASVLSGVVTGDGGDPVENAEVMLFEKPADQGPDAKITQAATATTDDRGAYEFPNLAAGEYLLAVRARPWYAMSEFAIGFENETEPEHEAGQVAALDVTYPLTFYDATTDEGTATPIVLSGGGRQDANISLHAVPTLYLQVQAAQKADGTVAQPELQQSVFGVEMDTGSQFSLRSKDGRIELGVPPGQYELTQGDPPHLLEISATASQRVDPEAGTPAVAVKGTLQPAQNAAPNSTYTVSLEPVKVASASQPLSTFASDRTFSFRAVPAGVWKLAVQNGPDVVAITVDGKTQPGDRLVVQDRTLSLSVTLAPPKVLRVEGFARKGDKAFSGAMVVLVPRDLNSIAELARRDQSNSDGSFALENARPGDYTVVAIEDGWELDWANPATIARYLPGGVAVTVKGSIAAEPGARMSLAQPITVQARWISLEPGFVEAGVKG